jgi:hypothetical protein
MLQMKIVSVFKVSTLVLRHKYFHTTLVSQNLLKFARSVQNRRKTPTDESKMTIGNNNKMMAHLQYRVRMVLQDSRTFVGYFKGWILAFFF